MNTKIQKFGQNKFNGKTSYGTNMKIRNFLMFENTAILNSSNFVIFTLLKKKQNCWTMNVKEM